MNLGIGFLFAILSLVFNGSFSSLNKLPKVVESKVDPLVFNMYFSIGVILSSIFTYVILLIMGEKVTFTYLGVVSGVLLAFAALFTFATIKKIGLSIGVAIWSGAAILTSFFEGLIAQHNKYNPNSWILSITGIVILIIGILGVAFSKLISELVFGFEMDTSETEALLSPQERNLFDDTNSQISEQVFVQNNNNNNNSSSPVINVNKNEGLISQNSRSNNNITHDQLLDEMDLTVWLLGILYAILTGLCGGSVALPTIYTDGTNSGAKFLISFSFGVILVFPITFLYHCLFNNKPLLWHFKICFLPGFSSGIIWNLGNLCSIFAIQALGYSVAYPIMQSSLIVATIWGVFIWKEITNKHIIYTLFFFCAVVIAGCILIGYGVDG